jgi:hypothetical protein
MHGIASQDFIVLKAEHLINILQFQFSKGRGSNRGRLLRAGITVLMGVAWKAEALRRLSNK